MLGRVEELIQAPGSPNLYWALTDLPRPLLDLRKALQGEKLITDAEFRRRHHQPTFHMQGEKLLIDAFIAQNRPRPASLAAPGSLYSHSAGGFDSTAADPG